MDGADVSYGELAVALYRKLRLSKPPQTANRFQWLCWQLIWLNDKAELKRCIRQIAESRGVDKKVVCKKVIYLRQCELPKSVVAPILNAATTLSAHRKGKRVEIQCVVREALFDFLAKDLRASKFGLNRYQIKQLTASCISQRLQQMISKRSKRSSMRKGTRITASDEEFAKLHAQIVAALRQEYLSPDGWRFPIFDMHGRLAEFPGRSPGERH